MIFQISFCKTFLGQYETQAIANELVSLIITHNDCRAGFGYNSYLMAKISEKKKPFIWQDFKCIFD